MTKVCKKCGSSKFIPVKRKRTDGTPYMTSRCGECTNTYQKKNRHLTRNWQEKNREYWNKYCRERYTKEVGRRKNGTNAKRLRERTPTWADKKKIAEFYANKPEGYHVDHIIPLNGKTVSGLHVLENLQYLPASENCSKSNKF